tara:strand:+ start:96 stop:542 length:447 start_codon:yes stop_codon:yes gene_type:complete
MMKKIFILVVSIYLIGCASKSQLGITSLDDISVYDESVLSYLYFPNETKVIINESVIIGVDDNWVGRINLFSDITKDKIYSYVVEKYKENGWDPVTAFRTENDLMVFQKNEKYITIELSDARKIGQETKIIFTLSSKDKKIRINQISK